MPIYKVSFFKPEYFIKAENEEEAIENAIYELHDDLSASDLSMFDDKAEIQPANEAEIK